MFVRKVYNWSICDECPTSSSSTSSLLSGESSSCDLSAIIEESEPTSSEYTLSDSEYEIEPQNDAEIIVSFSHKFSN